MMFKLQRLIIIMVMFFQNCKISTCTYLKGISILFLFGILFTINAYSKERINRPMVWDYDELVTLKKDSLSSSTVQQYIYSANKICNKEPVIITRKSKTFAPDNHYYCSVGSYWWPDTLNAGKYVNKDGKTNPESLEYDITTLKKLTSQCRILSKAFFFTNDLKYYNAFVIQLHSFFINEETRMYPTFEYAQVIPGKNNNKGRSTGMIDSYSFNTIIESIRLVDGVKRIDRRTMRRLKRWFYEFAEWAENGVSGESLHKSNTNVALAYDVTIANVYLFAGEETKAKLIVDGFEDRRISVQIKEDGTQPNELQRTKAFSYSLFNLTHIIDLCYLARYWYPNYYQEHRERIDKAFEFLGQYVDNPESFPYQQISDWDNCKKNFWKQLRRVEYLRNIEKKGDKLI